MSSVAVKMYCHPKAVGFPNVVKVQQNHPKKVTNWNKEKYDFHPTEECLFHQRMEE